MKRLCLIAAMFSLPHCAAPLRQEPPRSKGDRNARTASIVAEFRVANKPRIVDGVPADSSLDGRAREQWCKRLAHSAEQHLAQPGDALGAIDRCGLTLLPAPSRQVVSDVRVRFDADF